MKDDELTLVWGALIDPTRRAILDLLRERRRMWQYGGTDQDQTDQRVRRWPGEGPALLRRTAGLRKVRGVQSI